MLTRRWWRGPGQSSSGLVGGRYVGLSMRWCVRRHRILQVVLQGDQHFRFWDKRDGGFAAMMAQTTPAMTAEEDLWYILSCLRLIVINYH